VRFAENPPKTYEDIVNIKFDGAALPDAWCAWRNVILFWIGNGVRIFRVDNPHTKPLPFWRWLIAEINRDHPDVIFLAEAFTRPKMMKRLAKIGFQQSYTYFTWSNTKNEIIEYMNELAGPMSAYYRPNFFTNTPDINPFYLQTSGRSGFIVRATLAATLSPSWGIYTGFELCEAEALPEREEYRDSEKYELRARDFSDPINIKEHIVKLNRIRNAHSAMKNLNSLRFLNAWNDHIIAYARLAEDRSETIFVMVNLDPHNTHECVYEAPLWDFGLSDFASLEVEDLLLGGLFRLSGKTHQIALDPNHNPVIIWRLINPASNGHAS
jgi:starch synthase (maltosyl-transferring)